uniref:Uncharacterized protein n=1 Tax=Populus trichocarpa TaxID=3694 RepID=A9P9R9_POPTR|nr:unknown [Populus trichocarpa]
MLPSHPNPTQLSPPSSTLTSLQPHLTNPRRKVPPLEA